MKLSIVIPAYDEEKTILEVIKKVKKVRLNNITKEIIIVDDFSEDNTRRILSEINDSSIKLFLHKKKHGKRCSNKDRAQVCYW